MLSRRGLPENVVYHDTGCELAPSCLQCPFPECRWDVQGGVKAIRNAAIKAAKEAGKAANEIAEKYGVSRRTVYRASEAMTDHERMVALRKEGLLLKEIARIMHRDHSTVLHHLRGDCKRC